MIYNRERHKRLVIRSESLKNQWTDRLSSNEIAEKTMDEWVIWLNVLDRKYGKRILCDISTQEILEFRNKIAEKDSNVSSNKYLSIFRKVFKQGLDLNAVLKDPTYGIKRLSEKQHECKTAYNNDPPKAVIGVQI